MRIFVVLSRALLGLDRTDRFRLILIGFVLLFIILTSTFNRILITKKPTGRVLSASAQSLDNGSLSADQTPEFILETDGALVNSASETSTGELQADNGKVKAQLSRQDKKNAPIPVLSSDPAQGKDKFTIEVPKDSSFVPGKYHIDISFETNDKKTQQTFSQDFTWGVLALNFDKDVYLPTEEASIGIGVLDDNGQMICDADVKLEITKPDGSRDQLATSEKDISISDQCSVHGVTDKPDYYANYKFTSAGDYGLKLTAKTANGVKTISSKVKVDENPDFQISRTGATRIYPKDNYTMAITAMANKDWSGPVREFVPKSFKIVSAGGATVTEDDTQQILTWDQDFAKGDSKTFSYTYKAPEISPEFYLLGPVKIGPVAGNKLTTTTTSTATSTITPTATPTPTATTNPSLASATDSIIIPSTTPTITPTLSPATSPTSTITTSPTPTATTTPAQSDHIYQEARQWQIASDAASTCTAKASAAWSATTTWTCVGGSTIPVAGDIVIIPSSFTVTVGANAAAASIEIKSPGAATGLNIGTGYDVTLTGALLFDAPGAAFAQTVTLTTTATLHAGSITMQASTIAGASSLITFTGAGVATVTGAVTMATGANTGLQTISVGTGTLIAGSASMTGGGSTGKATISASTGTRTFNGNVAFAGTAANAVISTSGIAQINLNNSSIGIGGTLTLTAGTKLTTTGTSAVNLASATWGLITVTSGAFTMGAAATTTGITITAGTFTLGGAMTLNGNLITGNSTTYSGAYTTTITGAARTLGTTGATGVTLTFNALTLAASATATANLNFTVTNALTFTSTTAAAQSLTLNANTVTATLNTVTMNQPGGAYTSAFNINAGIANCSGVINLAGTTSTATWISTVVVTTGVLTTSANITFAAVTTPASKKVTVGAGLITITTAQTLSSGTMTITSTGTIDFQAGLTLTTSATAATFTQFSGALVKMGGPFISNTTAYVFTVGSKVEFDDAGSNTVTPNAAITFADVQIDSGSTVTLVVAGFTVAGNWTNNYAASGIGGLAGNFVITFSGATKTIGGTAGTNFYGLIITSSASAAASITINTGASVGAGNFVITPGAYATTFTHASGVALTVTGAVTMNQPTGIATSAWNINDGNAVVTGTVALAGTATTATYISKINITTGTLEMNATSSITFAGSTPATKVVAITGAGTIKVAGSIGTPASSTSSPGTTSTWVFDGTAAGQSIPVTWGTAAAYANLQILNTNAAGAYPAAAITATNMTGNITVGDDSNTAAIFKNGSVNMADSGTSAFVVKNGATFQMDGTTAVFPTSFGTFTFGTTSTTIYNQTGAQNIYNVASPGYGNLSLTPAGTVAYTGQAGSLLVQGNLIVGNGTNILTFTNVTSDPTINVNGNTTIAAAAILIASDLNPMLLAGNWLNSGAYTSTGSAVTLDGAAAQSVTCGSSSFNNLTITNASGSGVTFVDSATVTGTFTDTTPNSKLIFTSTKTYAFTAININGNGTGNVTMTVTGAGSWLFNVPGTPTVTYVTADHSDATGSGAAIDATSNCTDGAGGGTNTNWTFVNVINISGSCQKYNEATNCASSEVIKVAVGTSVQAQITTTNFSTGLWTISGVSQPANNAIITIFIDSVGDELEANAVTKYDGSGNISGILLYERHLSLGSADNLTVANSDIATYDNSVSANEDIFFEVDSNNDLTVPAPATSSYSDQKVNIKASNIYRPDSGSSGFLYTHDLINNGTITADGNSFYLSGSYRNSSVFTCNTSTVIMTATSGSETIDSTGASVAAFNSLTLGNTSGTDTAGSIVTVNDVLATASGTFNMATYQLLGAFTPTNGGMLQTQCTSNPPIPTGKTWDGTVEYNATAGSQTVVTGTYNILTLSNTSGTDTAGNTLTVNIGLNTTSGGTLAMGSYQLLGNLTPTNNGTITTLSTADPAIPTHDTDGENWTGTTGVVQFAKTDGGQYVPVGTYGTLTFSNTSNTDTADGAITATTLNTTASGILNMQTYALAVTNVTSNGIIRTQNTLTPITAGKTWGGTVQYDSTVASQTVVAGTYNNLIIDKTAQTATLGGNITVGAVFTITSGIFDASSCIITLSGSGTPFVKTGTFMASASTVSYTGGTTATNITSATYNNLYLNHTGTIFTAAGDITAGGILTINAGTFDGSNKTITLTGSGTPFVNNGTLSANTSTFRYTGNAATTVSAATYNNLELKNTGVGNGVSLGGSTNKVSASANAALNISTNLTLETWVYLNTDAQNAGLIYKGDNSNNQGDYNMSIYSSSGSETIYFYTNGTGLASTTAITKNLLHHVACTYDGSYKRIWLDGVKVGEVAYSTPIAANNYPLNIGNYYSGGYGVNGQIFATRISSTVRYTTTFTPSTTWTNDTNTALLWNYEEGSGTSVTDSSSNGITGTLSGGSWWLAGNQAKVGDGVSLAGSTNKVSAGTNAALNINTNLTCEAWIKLSAANTNNGLIYKGSLSNSQGEYSFGFITGSVTRLVVRLNGSTTEGSGQATSPTTLNLNQLYHVAFTYDGANIKIWINGTLDKTSPYTAAITNTNVGLMVGNYYNGSYGLNGSTYSTRISSTVRYTTTFTPSTTWTNDTNTALLWNYEEGSGTSVTDSSSNGITGTLSGGSWAGVVGQTTDTLASGTITVANLILGDGSHQVKVLANTNNPTIAASDNFTISSLGVYFASTNSLSVGGDWTNSGILYNSSGGVTLNGSGSQTITSIAGPLANLTITNASASGITFADGIIVAGTFTDTTASSKVTFHSGSTYAFNAININGQATGTRVVLTSSTGGSPWNLNITASSPTASNVSVKDSNANKDIDATTGGYDATGNTHWLFTAVPSAITISGTVYTAENKGTNVGTNKTIALSINGATATTVETTSGGAFSFSSVTVATNNTVSVYISGETEKGSLITQAASGSSDITGLELYTGHIVLSHNTAGPMTNTLLATANTIADSDMLISTSSGNTTFTSGNTVWILAGKTYTPGGNVSAGSINILSTGTFSPEGNTVTLNDSGTPFTIAGIFNQSTSTVIYAGSSATNVTGSTYYNLQTNHTGTTFIIAGSTTVNSVLTNSAGTLDGSSQNIILAGSGTPFVNSDTFTATTSTVKYQGTSATNITPATYYAVEFSSVSGSPTYTLAAGTLNTNNNFTIGDGTHVVTVNADTNDPIVNVDGNFANSTGATFVASASAAFSVASNFTNAGTFTHSGGTLTLDGQGLQSITSGGSSFNNLTTTNASTAGVTFADSATTAGTFTDTTASSKVTFNSGSTYAFNAISINGQATGTRVVLTSSTSASPWNLNITASSPTASNVSVKDSNANKDIDATTGGFDATGNTNWLFPSAPSTITISGTVYTAENKSTNIGFGKTIKLSVNGAAATSVSSGSGGTFSFSSISVAANNTVAVYVSGDTQKASLITQAVNSSTDITALELYTGHIILSHQTAGPMTNTLLATANTIADSDMLVSTSSGNTTFTSGNTVWILAGKAYTPGGNVTAGSINILTTGTFSPEANTVTLNDSGTPFTIAGIFNQAASTVIYAGATATNVTGSTYNNLQLNHAGTTFTVAGSTTVTNVLTISAGTLDGSNQTIILSGIGTPFVVTGTFTPSASTVKYTGAGDTNITAANYNNLETSPSEGSGTGNGWVAVGAGDNSYNGTYVASGTFNTQPSYTNGSRWLFWAYEASLSNYRWCMSTSAANPSSGRCMFDDAYYAYGNVALPSSWFVGTGTASAPSLSQSAAATSYTFASGTTNVAGNYVNGDGSHTVTTNLDTNDPIINIDGDFNNAAGATFISSASAAFSVASDFTNSATGKLTANGLLTLDGQGLQTITAGGTDGDHDFNNLTITNASVDGVSFADSATVAGTFTDTTASSKVTFHSGSTYAFNAININGQATGTRVVLTSSTSASPWNLNITASSPTASNVSVKDSNANKDIDATTGGLDATGNTHWLFTAAPSAITISGTVYTAENKSTNIGSGKAIALSINGATKTTATTGSGGIFSFSSISVAANDTVAVYISGETEKGSLITQAASSSTDITGLELYTGHIVLSHNTAGPMTNALLATANTIADSDMLVSTSSGNTAFTSGNTVWILAGKAYTPGGNVSAGSINILSTGTFSPEANTVTLNDSGTPFTIAGTFNQSTSTVIYAGSSATNVTGSTYNNLTVNHAGTTFTVAGSTTVTNVLTISAGTLDGSNQTITLSGTGTPLVITGTFTPSASTISYTGSSATSITAATYSNLYLNHTGTTFTAVGNMTVSAVLTINAGTFDASDKTIILPSAGTPFVKTGTFTASTSTIKYTGTTATNIAAAAYYNLETSPSGGTTPTYTLATGTINTNNYTNGDGTNGVNTTADANDPIINIDGNFVNSASATFIASASAAFSIASNFTNSGIFTDSAGTLVLDGAAAQTITVGGTGADNDFKNLTATNASASGVTFADSATVTGTFTDTTASSKLYFHAGSTYAFANINIDGGDFYTRILMHSDSNGSAWVFTVANATPTVSYVDAQDSDARTSTAAIDAITGGKDSTGNQNWLFPAADGTISGTFYTAEDESTNVGANKTVALSVNGAAKTTVETDAAGKFTFTSITYTSTDMFSIFLDDETEKGSFVGTANNSLSYEGIKAFTGIVKLADFDASSASITNAMLAIADNCADTDQKLSVDGSNVATFASGMKLWVRAGTTYVPGGNVIADNAKITGTLTLAANTMTLSGDLENAGAITGSGNVTISGGDATGNGTLDLTAGTFLLDGVGNFGGTTNWNFNNLTFGDGSGTTTTTKTSSNQISTSGVLTIAAGQTLDASDDTWNLSGAGTTFVNSGQFLQNTSTFVYNSSSAENVTGSTYYNLTLNHTGTTFTAAGSTTVTNVLTTSAGTLDGSNQTITLSGTTGTPFVITGTFVPSTSTVIYSGNYAGGNTNVAGTAYYNLGLNNAAETYIAAGDITASGILTITAGTFDASSRTIYLSGTTGTPLVITGTFAPSTSTVMYFGNYTGGNTNVAGTAYYNLQFNNAAETYIAAGDITVSDVLTISAGTFDASSRTITLSGTGTPFVVTGTFAPSTSTIAYTGGTAAVNVTGSTYYNLTLNHTGTTFTAAGDITVSDVLTISAGTFDASSRTITLSGTGTPFVKTGTFTPSTSTINYTGSSATTVSSTTYYNLGVGTTSDSGTAVTYTLAGDTTVSSVLTVGNASSTNTDALATGSYTVNLIGSGTPLVVTTKGSITGAGTVNYTGSSATNVAAATYNNLTLNHAGTTFTAADDITALGVLTITAGTFDASNRTINLSGAIGAPLVITGTFTPSTSTIIYSGNYNGGNIDVAGTTYYNLQLNNAAEIYIAVGDITTSNVLTITAGTFDASNKTITLSGTGTPFVKTGTFTASTSTVKYTGAGDTIIAAATYNNLETSPSAMPTAGWIVSGAGDSSYNGTYGEDSTYDSHPRYTNGTRFLFWSSVQWALGPNSDGSPPIAYLGASADLPANAWTAMDGPAPPPTLAATPPAYAYTFASGTINVNGNYTNGDGTHTASITADTNDPTLSIDGNFVNSASATFIASASASFSVASNYTNSATGIITDSGSTLTLDGQGLQTITAGGTDASHNFYNLVVTNASASGVSFADSATVSSTFTDTTVSSKLTFNSGSTYAFNAISLNGQAVGTRIILTSSSSGTPWNLTISAASPTANYVNVKDSTANKDIDATTGGYDATGNTHWLFNTRPVNDSLTFTNPYSSNIVVADDTTLWNYQAKVTDADGPTDINYVEIHFANSADSSQPYDSLKYRWTRGTNTFSEIADTQSAGTIDATSSASAVGNQWTINFKIKFNSSFTTTSTNYAAELYSVDNYPVADTDNYSNIFQVNALTLSLSVDSATMEFGQLLPGSIATGNTHTTVTTNYPAGYSLYVSDSVPNPWSALLLQSDHVTRIADYASSIASPSSWNGTGLGICLYNATGKSTITWGTGTTATDANNKYAGVPTDPTLINTKAGTPTNSDSAYIGYKLVVPSTQKTGTYQGEVIYTATGLLN